MFHEIENLKNQRIKSGIRSSIPGIPFLGIQSSIWSKIVRKENARNHFAWTVFHLRTGLHLKYKISE